MKAGAESLHEKRRKSDATLTVAAASGDMAAKRLLVDRLLSSVRTTLHYLAPGDRDADDLVQSAMIEILRSVGSFRGAGNLELWACRVAIRTAMHYLRNRRSRHRLLPEAPPLEPIDTETPEASFERLRLRRRIKAVLERMPIEQRTALVLRFVHGLGPEEIADVMECPLNTARERLRVGRKRFLRFSMRDAALREWAERND